MTTATVISQRPSTILRPTVHRKGPTILKRPRHHVVKNTEAAKPVLLRILRHYYSRRRSSISIANVSEASTESLNRKVQFYPRVRVKRIPSRLSYSQEDRLNLWVPKKELKQMVSRNYVESAWEGDDWQTAPEEDEFTLQNGRLIHPCYVQAQNWTEDESEEGELMEKDSQDADDDDEQGNVASAD